MPHRQNDHKLNYAVKLHMMKRILTNEVRLLMDTCMYVCVCVCVCVYVYVCMYGYSNAQPLK